MKMVTGIIRAERLRDVKDALLEAGITSMTASVVLGIGEKRAVRYTKDGEEGVKTAVFPVP